MMQCVAQEGMSRLWRRSGIILFYRDRALSRFLREEVDTNLCSVDPNQLTPSKCQTGGRQNEEKFLSLEHVGGPLYFELRPGRRGVEENASSPPSPVCADDVDQVLVFKMYAAGLSAAPPHRNPPN